MTRYLVGLGSILIEQCSKATNACSKRAKYNGPVAASHARLASLFI